MPQKLNVTVGVDVSEKGIKRMVGNSQKLIKA